MLCERCHLRPATQKVVEVVAGERHEWHLCEECALEVAYGLVTPAPPEKESLAERSAPPPPGAHLECPSCGLTYREFLQALRFGCAHCYEAFAENLQVLLRELHGSARYRGTPYAPDPEKTSQIQELAQLHRHLRAAVAREDFERAAQIRDQIQALREKLGWTNTSANR